MIRPIQLGDLVRSAMHSSLDPDRGDFPDRKGAGLVVGFDTKHGTGSIQVRWPSAGRTDWATSWQLEVISESR